MPSFDLGAAIEAMAAAGQDGYRPRSACGARTRSTWYIFSSANDDLKSRLGRRVATGEALGGTALSNPMKTFFGIEPIKLKGKRVDGGFLVLRRAAFRLQPRRRSLFRRDLRGRGGAAAAS